MTSAPATLPLTVPFSLVPDPPVTGPAGTPGGGSPGIPVNPDVGPGGIYDVAFDSIGFVLDTGVERPYRVGYQQQQKQQFDTSNEPGEHSLELGFWRRSRSSWHGGAGQTWIDADTETEQSSAVRFNESYGVDPWTKHELTLLHDVENKKVGVASNAGLMTAYDAAGVGYLYFFTSTSMFFTSNPSATTPTWSSVTGHAAAAITGMTSQGGFIYYGVGGVVWKRAVGSSGGATNFGTLPSGTGGILGVANGYMFAASDPKLYLVPSAGAGSATDVTPLAAGILAAISGSNFTWIGVCDGPRGPIAAGRTGERTYIFHGVVDATGALDHFESACTLPAGDKLVSIISYLNQYVVMGFTDGLRCAAYTDSGELQYGRKFGPETGVYALEAQDRFVWFSWPTITANLTSISLSTSATAVSGLGRLDLSVFTEPLVPAYAADLQTGVTSSTANVVGVATVAGQRYFAFNGALGVYGENANYVTSGILTTGKIRWSTLEKKHLRFVDLYHKPLTSGDTVTIEVSVDDGDYATLGTSSTVDAVQAELMLAASGRWFEHRVTLAGASTSVTPTLTGWTSKAIPQPTPYRYFDIWVLVFDSIRSLQGELIEGYPGYALTLLNRLDDLRLTQNPFLFQGKDYGIRVDNVVQTPTYVCVIDDLQFEQVAPGNVDSGGFGGRAHVLLREVSR